MLTSHVRIQVQGFAAGYFLWDLQISAQYIALSGPSALLHAIGALAVTCIGFVCHMTIYMFY